ncbi:SDR family NAD(P)-dependent oxidoreductase [Bradyrhizobium cytisi]|uniref:SDR family NAD(P)-dependent oxidoreductase n=1 Tax=Bradyrhizobium cytisi TaxID=515489 RepID=A0A5S4WZI5_9BRAD|nr:SDR family NAD(P)-dependent oxidoreductase [Bradyrhizobium cytisi]TYL87024.1 SDR family NAD(P)-dependent oxidoreductase [Bradyrhizobium cytisi]
MIESFDGRTAFVTGAASGIGLALARALAAEGAKVMLADIERGALDAALRDLQDSGADARAVACDVSDRASVVRAAEETFAAFGKVHVVCNNAGVGIGGPVEAITLIGVNFMGAVHGIQAFLPHIKAHGEGGHVVNTASLAGLAGPAGIAPYNATKAAVISLTETLAAELAGTDIGVSVLCTAFVRTRIATSARNRPARFGGADDAPANPQMAALVEVGLDPDFVADRVLAAIRSNDLYILTHPEMHDVVAGRFDQILAAFDKASLHEASTPPEAVSARPSSA